MPSSDVVVIGAGAIGAAVAWRCAGQGLRVVSIDPAPDRGAWTAAAGMLAPATEASFTETPLLRLNLAAARRWPAFAAELAADAGTSIGFRTCGTVLVAWDAADLAGLRDLHTFARSVDVDAELVTGRQLRLLEPALAPGLPGGYHAPGDHQVDPRLLHAALVAAGRRRGVTTVASAGTVVIDGDRVSGVRTADGTVYSSAQVVVAAGAWSSQIAGVPAGTAPVRPVKGQTLRLRLPGAPRLTRVVRGRVGGSPVYLVPRADGQIVVGASSEEAGFDVQPRAGAVYELLRDAQTLVPELSEAVLEQVSTGLRPGSPDNAPLIGATDVDGLIVAAGHYRNGILLTPVTADAIAEQVVEGMVDEVVRPFTPRRFGSRTRSVSFADADTAVARS